MPKRLEYVVTAAGQTWSLDYYSLELDDWCAAERATGMHWAFLSQQLDNRSAVGIKLAYWFARRRENPSLGWDAPEMKVKVTDIQLDVVQDQGDEGDGEGEQRPDPPRPPRSDGSATGS